MNGLINIQMNGVNNEMLNGALNHLFEGVMMFVIMSALVVLSRTIIRKVPVLAESRYSNIAEDKKRIAMAKYPPVLWQNKVIGLGMFVPLIILIAPFFASFEALPWWRYFTDILWVFVVYDFFYYLMHRFLFHENKTFKKIHGLHHQARNPSHIDAQYVHPIETIMGLLLFYFSVLGVGWFLGDFHVVSLALCFFFYGQLNILNHANVQIEAYPWRIATWISKKHHNHHIDMSHGNYASLIMLYDKLFGTFE